jgi:hypothetical protein
MVSVQKVQVMYVTSLQKAASELKVKVKLSLYQAMEAHRVVRR